MKSIAAFFSLFCIYLLHPTEAKADTYFSAGEYVRYHQSDQRFENTSPLLSNHCRTSPDVRKWVPWSCIISEKIQVVLHEGHFTGTPTVFRRAGARDFYVHSGLSPPRQFALN